MTRVAPSFPIVRPLIPILLVAACHHPVARPVEAAVPIVASIDAMPIDATIDADEAPVGAVPIPGTYPVDEVSINELDRTVTLADLPAADAPWKTKKSLKYKGRVAIALHTSSHEFLEVAVVDTATETETGYPGSLESVRLSTIDPDAQPSDGNAFSPRDVDPTSGEYRGPIMFAIRALPKQKAPEAERRQWVVYTRDRAIFIVDKLVTEARWTPRMRIDVPKATEIIAMNPGWH